MSSAYQWSDTLLLRIMMAATSSAPLCKIKSWSQVAPMFLFTLWPTLDDWGIAYGMADFKGPAQVNKLRPDWEQQYSHQTRQSFIKALIPEPSCVTALAICRPSLLAFFLLFSTGNAHSWGPCVFFWAWFEGADRCTRPWLSHWSISNLFWGKLRWKPAL